jgi:hypothetical protein
VNRYPGLSDPGRCQAPPGVSAGTWSETASTSVRLQPDLQSDLQVERVHVAPSSSVF